MTVFLKNIFIPNKQSIKYWRKFICQIHIDGHWNLKNPVHKNNISISFHKLILTHTTTKSWSFL